MPNKLLDREFRDGLRYPLYYLWSEEGIFIENALAGFIEKVIENGPVDFNYDVFDSGAIAENILDAAETLPVMASRRLVVLRDFHQYPASVVQSLMPYFKSPSESTCMLVLSHKPPKASWKVDWKIFSLNVSERDIPLWLKRTAADRGFNLTDDAVELLIERVGYEAGLLAMELEKASLLGKKRITGKDIAETTGVTRQFSPFDLIDAIISGQTSKAFRILMVMFERNSPDAPVILGTLNWHYRQFYDLWKNRGKRPARMRDRTYRFLLKHLHRYKEDDFYSIFKSLHEADLGIKTSGRAEIVIETLMIRLLQIGTSH